MRPKPLREKKTTSKFLRFRFRIRAAGCCSISVQGFIYVSRMATGERYLAMTTSHQHEYFLSSPISTSDHIFEDFEESDIWNTAVAISSSHDDGEFHKAVASSRGKNKKNAMAASSLPMNVPDWSKILRGDYRESRHDFEFDDDEEVEEDEGEEDGGVRFPPHEFLARQRRLRTTSFSVHEGIGRTLKGRDLSRVRDAIWKQTGFED